MFLEMELFQNIEVSPVFP